MKHSNNSRVKNVSAFRFRLGISTWIKTLSKALLMALFLQHIGAIRLKDTLFLISKTCNG